MDNMLVLNIVIIIILVLIGLLLIKWLRRPRVGDENVEELIQKLLQDDEDASTTAAMTGRPQEQEKPPVDLEEQTSAEEEVTLKSPPVPEPEPPLAPPVVVPKAPPSDDKQEITDRLKLKDVQKKDEEDKLHEKAKRKARVIVREIQNYHKEKMEMGLRENNLFKYLKDEIEAGRKAYNQEVSEEIRKDTNYFDESLVAILAKGDPKILGK